MNFHFILPVPQAPTDVTALVNGTQSILVSWRPPTPMNGILSQYTVHWRENESDAEPKKENVPSNQTSFEIFGLEMDKPYEFWVTASTTFGESQNSESFIAIPSDKLATATIATFTDTFTVDIQQTAELPCLAVGSPIPKITWKVRIILL